MQMTLNLVEMRKNKLFVCTPMYGGNCNGLYMKACLDLQSICQMHGIEIRFSFLFNESLITRARNYLADEFLRSGFTHMLFIDSDILFEPYDVLAMMQLDKDLIGGPYPKKSLNWKNVFNMSKNVLNNPNFDPKTFDPSALQNVTGDYVFNPVPGTKQFNVEEPLEVMEIGTGFMMIKRAVFDKFREEYPHLRYKPDHMGQPNFDGSRYIHAYFETVIDPDSERYLSEDYMFAQYWRAIGGQVWLCPWMKTTHVGTFGFPGDMRAIAANLGSLG